MSKWHTEVNVIHGMSVTQKLLIHTECHNGTIKLLVNTESYSDKTDFKKKLTH